MADWDGDEVGHWDGNDGQMCANMNNISCATLRIGLSEFSAISPGYHVLPAHKLDPFK